MAFEAASTRVIQIPCEVYTASTKTSGTLQTLHQRFSDALNTGDQDFLLLRNIDTCTLGAPDGIQATAASALVRKDSVVIAVPREIRAGRERGTEPNTLYVHKRPVEAIIEVTPFVVRGVLHLPAAAETLQHAQDPGRPYIPVSSARVTHTTNPTLNFSTPFLLLNRRFIEVMVEVTQLGQNTETENTDNLDIRLIPVEAPAAAELLAMTSLFDKVPMPMLQEYCREMITGGSLTRLSVPDGMGLFSQGDLGKTLYLIESGQLAVERTTPLNRQPQQIATLNSREFAGEMALMGDGRRTSTVRAAGDAVVLAIDVVAVKLMMAQYPSAASSLLRIMLEREGGLDQSRRSLPDRGRPIGRTIPFRLADSTAVA